MRLATTLIALGLVGILTGPSSIADPGRIRARDLGVPFDGTPGELNAITDVTGVEVGYSTIISGNGSLEVGKGPVRTGVTAILPRGKKSVSVPVFAAWFSQNGFGEMTGTTSIEERGFLRGPVMITNTHSVGTVHEAVIAWRVKQGEPDAGGWWSLPIVAETYDGVLNDINGFHVGPQHAIQALESAKSGVVEEGNVGGGTGMICYGFKGGTGTASRKTEDDEGGFTVGVLVQANHGGKKQLLVAGVPVGRELAEKPGLSKQLWGKGDDVGSIIIVIATDAPLLPHQLKRVARRATMGLARTGSTSGNGSGDIFVAFSTANTEAARDKGIANVKMLPNERIDPLFEATVQATEEAIINAIVAAKTMTGINDTQVVALPHDEMKDVLKKYGRLTSSTD
ncbi:DmpA family aminopeptidase [Novipirellula artificiosorum]|uniref:Peptidase family S58 n=1 Tax=Novipirellula artificiosorum TaxID=2528016 RepID=A0A5C6CX33_9BACT|nr:P1 family peptidase [Novipirellula artificiosorum]TWU28988.1 Peptidase family S58 [Novipirellula artificiosorum]